MTEDTDQLIEELVDLLRIERDTIRNGEFDALAHLADLPAPIGQLAFVSRQLLFPLIEVLLLLFVMAADRAADRCACQRTDSHSTAGASGLRADDCAETAADDSTGSSPHPRR